MSPAQAQQSARPSFEEAVTPSTEAQAQPQYLGRFYVHNSAPLKGAVPEADGRCKYLLQCYRIADDATPGQIRDMYFTEAQAEYHIYDGFMSRGKGDRGLVVGYIEDLFASAPQADARIGMPTIVQTGYTGLLRPRVEVDTSAPRFGRMDHMAAPFDEIIDILNKVDANRHRHATRHIYKPAPKKGW